MDIYDLMGLYFPRRKATINRVRESDRSSREEAKIKVADHKAHGYKPKMTEEDFLSKADVIIPLSWVDNEANKIIDEINKLRMYNIANSSKRIYLETGENLITEQEKIYGMD